jgi:hypothetical protein
LSHDKVEVPFPGKTIAVFDHRGDLEARVHVEKGKRDMPEKRFPRKPEQYGRVLSHGPQHGEIVEMFVGFSENIDALIFELSKVSHTTLPNWA